MAKQEKKSGGPIKIVLIILTVLAMISVACGLLYSNVNNKKDVLDGEKGADKPKVVSLIDESTEAQRILDNILLQKDNWQLVENGHAVKEVEVEESGVKVKLKQRELAIGVPNTTSLTGAGAWLKEKVEAAGLVYISGEMGNYKKWDGYKVKVGFKAKAGEGTKTFKTDDITIFHNSNLLKEDKDVKDLPEEKKPEKKEDVNSGKKFSGKLAIIIDDCGTDMAAVRMLLNTGLPFSYAILPDKTYSSDILDMVKAQGRIAMLHLPMEPLNRGEMSESWHTVTVSQTKSQQQELVRKAISGLPGISGINNHQGSRATADKTTMQNVLAVARSNGLFFVDSRTNSSSVAASTAQSMGVGTAKNDIFLDNSSDPSAIRAQIYKAMAMADKYGSCIAICHSRPGTAKCWQMYADEFKKTGINFVSVDQLLY